MQNNNNILIVFYILYFTYCTANIYSVHSVHTTACLHEAFQLFGQCAAHATPPVESCKSQVTISYKPQLVCMGMFISFECPLETCFTTQFCLVF